MPDRHDNPCLTNVRGGSRFPSRVTYPVWLSPSEVVLAMITGPSSAHTRRPCDTSIPKPPTSSYMGDTTLTWVLDLGLNE